MIILKAVFLLFAALLLSAYVLPLIGAAVSFLAAILFVNHSLKSHSEDSVPFFRFLAATLLLILALSLFSSFIK